MMNSRSFGTRIKDSDFSVTQDAVENGSEERGITDAGIGREDGTQAGGDLVFSIRRFSAQRSTGFSLIEMLCVLGIIAIFAAVLYPTLLHSLEIRGLENTAADIHSTLHRAKSQAAGNRLNHRVRFFQDGGIWRYTLERENSPNQWDLIPEFIPRTISDKFNVTVNIPNQAIVFTPLGYVSNYRSGQNTVVLQSSKLAQYNKPDRRLVSVFAGGGIRIQKSTSG